MTAKLDNVNERLIWMELVGNCSDWNDSLAVFPFPTCGQYTS